MPRSIPDIPGAPLHEIAHAVELAAEPRSAFAAATRAAERWGAELEPDSHNANRGRLRLPVTAGLRRGWLAGSLGVDAMGTGSRIVFRVAESDYFLQLGSVAVLAIGAAGALAVVLWPFFPQQLTPLAPFGALLAVCAWFLVARLHTSGPEEFLETVAAALKDADDPSPPAS